MLKNIYMVLILSIPNSLTPTLLAQVSPCVPPGDNLILNPGFELGYFGFTSDFGRGVNNGTHCNCATQGWILIANIFPHSSPACQQYPAAWSALYGPPNTATPSNPGHPANAAGITTAVCNDPLPDHTTGNGFFLTIDPDDCEDRSYWKQTLQVCPQTNYYFSAWVRNISGIPAPRLHFEVDGQLVTMPQDFPLREWVETAAVWNSGATDGVVTLELKNDLPGCIDNDVAIDDIFLGICARASLSSTPEHFYCPNDPDIHIQLTGYAEGFTHTEYKWQHRAPDGSGWEDVPGATDTILQLDAPGQEAAGWYRLVAAEAGNIAHGTCSVYSQPARLVALPMYDLTDTVYICTGEQYKGYYNGGLYSTTHQSIHACDSTYTLDLRVRGDIKVYLPNIFSPNDDGDNDQLQPWLSDQQLDYYRWRVFNRWGELVFAADAPDRSWDGYFRGKPCENGVYACYLEIEIRGCQRIFMNGDITLWR